MRRGLPIWSFHDSINVIKLLTNIMTEKVNASHGPGNNVTILYHFNSTYTFIHFSPHIL